MKANYSRKMFVLAIAVSVLFAAIWVAIGPVRASLGNSGVPVRCTPSGRYIPVGEAAFFDCVAADGTPFTDGQRVPDTYYLLVTDIVVTSIGWSDSRVPSYLHLHDSDDTDNRVYSLAIRGNAYGNEQFWGAPTNSLHFVTPYMVLPAGHRLEGENISESGGPNIEVYISGLLVTNLSYLPLVTGQ